jgi:hypothetical protein
VFVDRLDAEGQIIIDHLEAERNNERSIKMKMLVLPLDSMIVRKRMSDENGRGGLSMDLGPSSVVKGGPSCWR